MLGIALEINLCSTAEDNLPIIWYWNLILMAFQESVGVKWQISLNLNYMSPYYQGKIKPKKKSCSVSGQEIIFHQS